MIQKRFIVVAILAEDIEEDRLASVYGGKNGESYRASLQYPHIRTYVEDEQEVFVVDPDDPENFWEAQEFFMQEDVREFCVTQGSLLERWEDKR